MLLDLTFAFGKENTLQMINNRKEKSEGIYYIKLIKKTLHQILWFMLLDRYIKVK